MVWMPKGILVRLCWYNFQIHPIEASCILMPLTSKKTYDVAIVGSGPAGALAAYELAKAIRSQKSEMFRYLTDLGNHFDMFYEKIKTRGRLPSDYKKLDLTDSEQLALAVLKTLSSK